MAEMEMEEFTGKASLQFGIRDSFYEYFTTFDFTPRQ